MKKFVTLLLCAGMLIASQTASHAIEFKARGQWLMSFDLGQPQLLHSTRRGNVENKPTRENFEAIQRVRVGLDAIFSESLSATVLTQIGAQRWGKNAQGAALGTDGIVVKVRWAYLDWMVPDLPLKVRMGLQHITLPNKMGSVIFDDRVAGITASYKINENIGLTAWWMRPFNDNYGGDARNGAIVDQNYLDNMDLWGLSVPIKYDGYEFTPWVLYGIIGKNTLWSGGNNDVWTSWGTDGNLMNTMYPNPNMMNRGPDKYTNHATGKDYGSVFWFGLPIGITAFEPWNIEFDFNYGYSEEMGRFNAYKGNVSPENLKRSSIRREGWLAKAKVEYKLDWGTPGIFGWYSSGDDDNPQNGSERLPSIAPYQQMTGAMFANNPYTIVPWHNGDLALAGTWGVGLQLANMSFIDNLKHTLKATYFGGTNSPKMIKYMDTAYAWNSGWTAFSGPYMTTEDSFVELSLMNQYKMYDNFTVYCDLGYVVNGMNNSAWEKAGDRNSTFSKQDAWKAQLSFMYNF